MRLQQQSLQLVHSLGVSCHKIPFLCLPPSLILRSFTDAGQTPDLYLITPVTAGPWLQCRMPASMDLTAIEPTIASLIVAPEEVLRPNARCPKPQCRITDDLLTKCYDTAARMGRIGNSLSHLILALSQSLQSSSADASVQSLSDTSLQAFAFMTRELGRLMS